jgi:hypothetical protein
MSLARLAKTNLESGAMCRLAPAGAAVSTPATDDLEFNKNAANSTRDSCNARGWRDRRRPCDQLCQPAKVLCNRRQRELELRARGTAKAQSAKPQNSLEVCEQHLDLFAIAA